MIQKLFWVHLSQKLKVDITWLSWKKMSDKLYTNKKNNTAESLKDFKQLTHISISRALSRHSKSQYRNSRPVNSLLNQISLEEEQSLTKKKRIKWRVTDYISFLSPLSERAENRNSSHMALNFELTCPTQHPQLWNTAKEATDTTARSVQCGAVK